MARRKDKKQQVGSGTNYSSFTNDLFGSNDPPPSTLFGSVFGPPSNAKHGISGNNTRRGKGESSGSSTIQERNNNNDYGSQTVEPSYLSSSIYYGAQEVYSPNTQTNSSQSVNIKKDGRDNDDPNGADSASRGNWWQGSLYY